MCTERERRACRSEIAYCSQWVLVVFVVIVVLIKIFGG